MVICCVPGCNTDSWKSDGSVSFYDFPLNPGLKAKWIKQINTAIESKSMWFPRGRPVLCSKHFLNTDFKGDTDALKPRSIPSVFGHRYIGQDPESAERKTLEETKLSPLIVKFKRPEVNVIENESKLHISDVCSHSDYTVNSEADTESATHIFESVESNLHTLCTKNDSTKDFSSSCSKSNLQSSYQDNTNRTKLSTNEINVVQEQKMYDTLKQNFPHSSNGISANNVSKKSLCKQPNLMPKMTSKKKETNDLIEIGPNTFLKINPDVIKVNKKQTPSGNTVLQFIMDQKLAKDYAGDLIPKLIQGAPSSSIQEKNRSGTVEEAKSLDLNNKGAVLKTQQERVQHVIGHVIDNHVCEDSCVDLTLDEEAELMDTAEDDEVHSNVSVDKSGHQNDTDKTATKCVMDGSLSNSAKSVLEKAPVLLTTNMPLSHCFIDRPKYILQLKQKNRQIANLRSKISALGKRIEELEDRCIVQERQLSYSFVKRLKAIQKNASKGDPCATYILEQIRSYAIINNSKMRWSDSTLTQCAIWCRKAPYAYEYFKKAGFFKLPCLGTVKRFIKKHPEIKFQKSVVHKSFPEGEDDGESSSDFDFDELDAQNGELSENENNESETCEKILSEIAGASISENSTSKNLIEHKENHEIQTATDSIANQSSVQCTEHTIKKNSDASDCTESSDIPITVDTSNLELQEIMLPSGEVVQCYSSNFVGGTESGQYFIIPNVSDQSNAVDHEYNVVQTDSMPVILQNIENSQLHVQQDQLIFIANSSDQVECSETEVTSA